MFVMLKRWRRVCPQAAADDTGTGSSGPAATPALDAAALARLAELDPTGQSRLVERVLESFKTSVARLRPQWVAARVANDHAGLRMVVHTLKSSSASIGALALAARCAEVETMIRLGATHELGTGLDAFEVALDHALDMIDRTLKARP